MPPTRSRRFGPRLGSGRFVGADERAVRGQLGLTDTHFANPDGLDAPGHLLKRGGRDQARARGAMNKPFIRETVGLATATAAGRPLRNWNDLLSSYPNLIGVKTGHTNGAGWSQVAAARRGGVTIYATVLGGETRDGRNADLSALLTWGLSRYRTVWAIDGKRVYGTPRTAYGQDPVRLVAAKPALRVVHVERPLLERVVQPVEVELPVRQGQRLGEVVVLDRGTVVARSPLVAADAVEKPGAVGRVGFYAGRTLDHLGGLIG